ncbi:MAG TPA: YcnI family protein [Pseudonocardiaceae bacterium]|nr:YcnI family protein [Pseudonocardiaceae bacterium]
MTAVVGSALLVMPAAAHVTVTPSSAEAGSAAVLTFHVPNEEASADTTQIDMKMPTDHPIAQLLVQPLPGWTISVRTITLAKPIVTDDGQFDQAVSEVVWSGGKIAPGQFQNFSVSADPLPEGVSQLPFKAIQTYSNGDVTNWIDVSQPGQPEPDHPAPVLTLTTAAAPPVTAAPAGSDTAARGLAVGGLVCGLAGLALAALGWRRRRAPIPVELGPVASSEPTPAVPAAARDTTKRRTQGSQDTARHGTEGSRDTARRRTQGAQRGTGRR